MMVHSQRVKEEIKETRLKFSQGSAILLWEIINYEEPRNKLTNAQLNKMKPAAKIRLEQH